MYELVTDKKRTVAEAEQRRRRGCFVHWTSAASGPQLPLTVHQLRPRPIGEHSPGRSAIVDTTGLSGRYYIILFATPPFAMRDSSEPGDIDICDAIQRLALRLSSSEEADRGATGRLLGKAK